VICHEHFVADRRIQSRGTQYKNSSIIVKMKIFYSWQADTPARVGKQFVRQALDDAVEQLAEALDLDEAERPSVDQDTQGVLGSPPIAETIFEKIRASEVVVADVTLTCATPDGKKLINSNVAYELGFAHGHHGHGVILKVMNTHYGPPDDLPFDLKHRRWPEQFELAPDATTSQLREARASLAKRFARILKLYLEGKNPGKKHEPISSTINAASYWREEELIVEAGRPGGVRQDEEIVLGYSSIQPLCYLRIWPDSPLDELTGAEIRDYNESPIEPFIGRVGSYSFNRNRHGMITYVGERAQELFSSTQLFKNREIWGVNAFLLKSQEEMEVDFLPSVAYEEGLTRSLRIYLDHAFIKLGYPDIVHVEAGLVNVGGFRLVVSSILDPHLGPMYGDLSVTSTINKNDPPTIDAALLKIFESVFDAVGHERPENFNNFPPATA